MYPITSQRGFTLLETLIYLVLFSFLIGGGFLAAYQIIESSRSLSEKARVEAEANFVFRKIDWALNDEVSTVSEITDGFRITRSSGSLDFVLNEDGILELNDEELTSSRVTFSNLVVDDIAAVPPVPEALEISFDINGTPFGPTKRFIR